MEKGRKQGQEAAEREKLSRIYQLRG